MTLVSPEPGELHGEGQRQQEPEKDLNTEASHLQLLQGLHEIPVLAFLLGLLPAWVVSRQWNSVVLRRGLAEGGRQQSDYPSALPAGAGES
jgi:hypothetical protein